MPFPGGRHVTRSLIRKGRKREGEKRKKKEKADEICT
jgi:hypothetical protein